MFTDPQPSDCSKCRESMRAIIKSELSPLNIHLASTTHVALRSKLHLARAARPVWPVHLYLLRTSKGTTSQHLVSKWERPEQNYRIRNQIVSRYRVVISTYWLDND